MYVLEKQSNGSFKVRESSLLHGIRINQLSEYFTISENETYGFDLLDEANIPSNKKLIQKYKYSIDDEDFVKGKLYFSIGKFQTVRITKSSIVEFNGSQNVGFNGSYLFSLN